MLIWSSPKSYLSVRMSCRGTVVVQGPVFRRSRKIFVPKPAIKLSEALWRRPQEQGLFIPEIKYQNQNLKNRSASPSYKASLFCFVNWLFFFLYVICNTIETPILKVVNNSSPGPLIIRLSRNGSQVVYDLDILPRHFTLVFPL